MKNKAVVKLEVKDAESKKAVKKAITELDGATSCTLDFEKSTVVVLGDFNPTLLVNKLRKFVRAELVSFGPGRDAGKPQKNDGGGGNVDQQQPQKNDGGGGNVDQQQPQKNDGGGGNVDGESDMTKRVNKLMNLVKANLEMYGPVKGEGKLQKPVFVKKKAVVKLEGNDAESKAAMKAAIRELDGLISYTLDFEKSTLVVLGDIDPNVLIHKLREYVKAKLMSFGPERDEGTSKQNDGGGGNVDQLPEPI